MGRPDVTDFVRERIQFLEQTVLVFHWEVIVSQLVGSLSSVEKKKKNNNNKNNNNNNNKKEEAVYLVTDVRGCTSGGVF